MPGLQTHLATIGVVVAQAWLGRLCPMTIWEQKLRALAGQSTHDQSFIAHWIQVWLYCGFACLGSRDRLYGLRCTGARELALVATAPLIGPGIQGVSGDQAPS